MFRQWRKKNRIGHLMWNRVGTSLMLALVLGSITPSVGFTQNALLLEKARWTSDSKLIVRGQGPEGETVILTNAGLGTVLGQAVVKSDGSWIFVDKSMDMIPCRIAATAGNETDEKNVRNAPGDCEESLSGSHAGRFDAYEGTQTCLTCHTAEAKEAHASVHYQWLGDAAETVGLDTFKAGKLGGINDFCIYPDINWIGKLTNTNGDRVDAGCAKCHAGLGKKPTPNPTPDQLRNIDCLICHSDGYKRRVAWADGGYQYVPDTDNMTVSLRQAVTDLQKPSKDSCLNCHTKAGGGDNFKRGDIEEAHRNPTADFDVHMASKAMGGAGLSCLDCHSSSGHKIAGRGTDLRPREHSAEVSCAKCHGDQPHDNQRIDKHTARLNCTVCHIPHFAKEAPTDMDRDWSQPGDLVASKGLYEPHHRKGKNVTPAYRWFNGLSYFYQFGDAAQPNSAGKVVMSRPLGTINDEGAKIHAFKRHTATQPVDPETKRLLPLKIGKFFETGEIDEAVAAGATAVGWDYNGHEFAETVRLMGLYHEVAPKSEALACASCHDGGNRLNFAALGYTPKTQNNNRPLCASCHDDESGEWNASEYFTKVHDKHVRGKNLDCASCHTFSAAN